MRSLAGPALLLAALVVGISATSPRSAAALSCADYTSQTLTLELLGVTEDGAPMADTSAYSDFDVYLEGSPYGDPGFDLFAVTNATDTWRESYP
ncbi:MAG: hypothetical protein HY908_18525 [Myxococcales bacterium]|nr:hypothetical protein [Myxococcales bacterium]